MCKHCKKSGYCKLSNELEYWNDYDVNGNMIHRKYSDGDEDWNDYDENGNLIYRKSSIGYEAWRHKGKWVYEKPKDWQYE